MIKNFLGFQSEGKVKNAVLYIIQEMVNELTNALCWVSFLCSFIKNVLQWHNSGALLDEDTKLTFLTSIPSTQAGFKTWIQTWIQMLQTIHTSVCLYKLNFNYAYSSMLIHLRLTWDLGAVSRAHLWSQPVVKNGDIPYSKLILLQKDSKHSKSKCNNVYGLAEEKEAWIGGVPISGVWFCQPKFRIIIICTLKIKPQFL